MKLRELTRGTVPAWPPVLASSYGRGDTLDDDDQAILRGGVLNEQKRQLELQFERTSGGRASAVLTWDAPPSLRQVWSVLESNIGRRLRELRELEVGGLTGSALRERIRQRLKDGSAPRHEVSVSPAGIMAENAVSMIIGSGVGLTCQACGDEGAELTLPSGGEPFRFHNKCFTILLEERQRIERK